MYLKYYVVQNKNVSLHDYRSATLQMIQQIVNRLDVFQIHAFLFFLLHFT